MNESVSTLFMHLTALLARNGDARAAETLPNVSAGRLVGPIIGHDHQGDVAEGRCKHAGGVVADAAVDREESCVAGRVQGPIEERLFCSG